MFWSFRVLVRPCFFVQYFVCSVSWYSLFCPSPDFQSYSPDFQRITGKYFNMGFG
uniref:Uncharacterized protein n=1 Tax=Meloidogyne enterolobii TaxID=390850 RepID=A0A6V7W8U1_MELEN|nr:unnamed protein product [Meloidogyne enterolobii]